MRDSGCIIHVKVTDVYPAVSQRQQATKCCGRKGEHPWSLKPRASGGEKRRRKERENRVKNHK